MLVNINGTDYPTVKVNDTTYKVDVPLPAGNYTANATVSDDPKYEDKTSDNKPFEVLANVDLEITVTINPNKVSYGDVVECIITVVNNGPSDASGVLVNVAISDDLEYISDNLTDDSYESLKDLLMASIQSYDKSTGIWYIGDLAKDETVKLAILLKANFVGTRDVNGTVRSDDTEIYYSNNNDSADVTVTEVVDYPITVDVVPGLPGENTNITVHVPADVTGNVTVVLDGKEYPVTPVNGTAVLQVPLDAGIYNVTAKVEDDPKYADKESNVTEFPVKKVSDYPITIKVDPGMAGENSILTVTVPADVTGVVTVVLDGKEYIVTPVNGIAVLEVPLEAGQHVAYASVKDDPKYADKDSDSVKFPVEKVSGYDISLDVVPGNDGKDTVITVKVPYDAKGTVVITVDGKEYRVTPENGIATLKLPLGPGKHVVTAKLIDDPKYADSKTLEDVFTISDAKGETAPSEHSVKHNHAQHNLSDHATGNPILVLLVVLLSMGLVPFRKNRK